MSTNTIEALRVEGLKKSFGGVQAVRGVSYRVAAGEVVALIGANGAGKTTSFNLINGQIKPDAGRVLLYGDDITGMAPAQLFRRGVARTFQITATFGSMTVRENVQMALLSHAGQAASLWRRADRFQPEQALALLREVGLAEQAGQVTSSLTYGDLKRLELAVALANAPRLLLMDEPTAGMALAERSALMQLAVRTARARQIALLFVEHDMDVVFGHADRLIVMNQGEIIAEGTPDQIRADARVRAAYLGELKV